ncbi:histidinol-phosphate transaminase [Cellulophaga lytica]|uniref:Histidinol-phosphate aminotransferase n=1 Tax=Cellulophaga lytica (strain ATCC 23178 / DSM 7489 / JCM 8516 / NBRC 14961 / NCIMB 1423 / VKM B-1433 / Cy l20) TaxID=867900 RepID=F0RCP2_CELLC|nr:histidinol-phosphate transaminase [Cellulophaga lytica]ADY30774.1 Histidinol-phosphate aminotransferase [Cellulophaga lytica DSM 7489]WQG78305.1 histidinol-phosphate transaminase [Cellulophaga lytica]
MKDFNLDKLTRENVKGLSPYSSARDEYVSDGTEMVFLDANENPFSNGVNRYPDPQQRSLKSVLAEQKGVKTENLLLGNGSDEVLDLIYRAFCEPKEDNIITLPPTYGMYKVLSGINNIENKEVLLTANFEPNVDEILATANNNSKILFLCSPNNPTGNSFTAAKMHQLLEEFNGLVVVDEAYIDFSPQESWVTQLGNYPNLIVTQTLSKAYGLAGVRLGICIASEEIISVLNKIKPPYNVNELTQQRAKERVLDIDSVKQEVSKIMLEKEALSKVLLQVSFIEKVYASDANFILAKVDDATKRYNQLLEKGIVIRNRTTQPLCENTLRFTVGTPKENKQLINALNQINN